MPALAASLFIRSTRDWAVKRMPPPSFASVSRRSTSRVSPSPWLFVGGTAGASVALDVSTSSSMTTPEMSISPSRDFTAVNASSVLTNCTAPVRLPPSDLARSTVTRNTGPNGSKIGLRRSSFSVGWTFLRTMHPPDIGTSTGFPAFFAACCECHATFFSASLDLTMTHCPSSSCPDIVIAFTAASFFSNST